MTIEVRNMKRTRAVLRGFAILTLLLLAAASHAETFRIEIDYMVDGSVGGHSHEPSAGVIAAVVQMFACQGHTLIIDVSDAIPHYDALQMDPTTAWNIFDYDGVEDSFGDIKSTWYDHAGVSGWHYCVFAHQYEWINQGGFIFISGSSGLAEINGDDLIVSLGDFPYDGQPVGSPFEQAATLAHEFGHNLGLTHCGTMDCGSDNTGPDYVGPYVPNLASTMSYVFQLRGVKTNLLCQGLAPEFVPFRDIDYSHGTMCSLDENTLNEPWGTMLRSVDWNCSSTIGGTYSLNVSGGDGEGWCAAGPGVLTVLDDYDEWSNIVDSAKSRSAADLKNLPVEVCISSDEMREYDDKAVCPRPLLTVESCVTSEMRYVRAGGGPTGDATCENSLGSVADAVSDAPGGSVVIIEPGIWNEGHAIIRKNLYLTAPYSAVLR